jgi:LysM repeat protein
MFVWSGSAWVSVASEVESLAGFATQSYADNTPGTRMVVPSSISVGSGSGSVSTSGAVTFSGASSVTLDNVFNSTYDTYMLNVIFTGSQSNTTIDMNLRSSAPADLSGTNYYRIQTTTLVNTLSASQTSSNTIWPVSKVAGSGDRQNNRITIVMSNIADAAFKHGYAIGNTQDGDGDTEGSLRFFNYNFASAAAGMKLAVSAGTFSGTIRVYGFKN